MDWLTKGFTLIETLIAITLLMIISIGGMSANRLATAGITVNQLRSRANVLSVETMEAVHSIRAGDYYALSPGSYHPVFDGSRWSMVDGSETIEGFTRSVVLTKVYRQIACGNAVCDLVSGGGVSDETSLLAQVKVSWTLSGKTYDVILNNLITYWR